MKPFHIFEKYCDGRLILSLLGDLTFDSCPALLRRMLPVCSAEPAPQVEFDLAGVGHIDEAGHALMRSLEDKLRVRGGELRWAA